MAYYYMSGNQKKPIHIRPKTFREMSEDERMTFAELFEARHPELKDVTKDKEAALRRFLLVLEETDPAWAQVIQFARRAFPDIFLPGRSPSPDAVARTFRRVHEKQGKKEEEVQQ